jgi:hypothetical protein
MQAWLGRFSGPLPDAPGVCTRTTSNGSSTSLKNRLRCSEEVRNLPGRVFRKQLNRLYRKNLARKSLAACRIQVQMHEECDMVLPASQARTTPTTPPLHCLGSAIWVTGWTGSYGPIVPGDHPQTCWTGGHWGVGSCFVSMPTAGPEGSREKQKW